MTISNNSDLQGMTRVGRLVAEAHVWLATQVAPGITTGELDERGASFLRARGARSAPQLTYGFPGFNLISVNDEIVHGIPGSRVLQPGDVVKLDITAELDGFIADAARTIVLPGATALAKDLARCARQAFKSAMQVIAPGRPVRLIGRAIERTARKSGFSVLRELTGHGVGRTIHENPTIPNFDDPRERATLHEGLVIAVEPLLASAPAVVVEDPDGWTLRTSNGALAVHYENTVVVRNGRAVVLTSTSDLAA
ncbi:MAG TPA: type I methionyl aminopeptidase [Gemmatimonadales bacterium]|nr:type I methionyl aminopeptidase [Gemmatimonadales bacterium]